MTIIAIQTAIIPFILITLVVYIVLGIFVKNVLYLPFKTLNAIS